MAEFLSPFWTMALGALLLLAVATLTERVVTVRKGRTSPVARYLAPRVNSGWVIAIVGLPALAMGSFVTTLVFAALSFLALREFLSLTPTRVGDRKALFAAFFVAIPAQYALVATGWYGLFSILIPVYGFFALSAIATLAQDTQHFLERNAKIQWAVMVCIYGVSHAPALLFLDLPAPRHDSAVLLLYFLLLVTLSDGLQHLFGQLRGRSHFAPLLNPNLTTEGLLVGGLLTIAAGGLLQPLTPFTLWQALALSLAVVATGLFGSLVLAAVKRSLGVKEWGGAEGQGGMLDRLDTLAFSAPIFFHLTRHWLVS